jgi:hypothetical protein
MLVVGITVIVRMTGTRSESEGRADIYIFFEALGGQNNEMSTNTALPKNRASKPTVRCRATAVAARGRQRIDSYC